MRKLSFLVLAVALGAGTAFASHGAAPRTHAGVVQNVIDVDSICTHEPAGTCHPITGRAEALARVADLIARISGGQQPSRIDVTEESVADVNKVYIGRLFLPPDRQVWYVRTYDPVTLTAEAGYYLPANVTLYKAHGAAFVIDAQTGILVATAAFD